MSANATNPASSARQLAESTTKAGHDRPRMATVSEFGGCMLLVKSQWNSTVLNRTFTSKLKAKRSIFHQSSPLAQLDSCQKQKVGDSAALRAKANSVRSNPDKVCAQGWNLTLVIWLSLRHLLHDEKYICQLPYRLGVLLMHRWSDQVSLHVEQDDSRLATRAALAYPAPHVNAAQAASHHHPRK
jgi:hypothetical protein